MKGKNDLYLNQATMQEAVQLWLAAEFKNPPKVVLVKKDTNRNSHNDSFIVSVDENSSENKECSTTS